MAERDDDLVGQLSAAGAPERHVQVAGGLDARPHAVRVAGEAGPEARLGADASEARQQLEAVRAGVLHPARRRRGAGRLLGGRAVRGQDGCAEQRRAEGTHGATFYVGSALACAKGSAKMAAVLASRERDGPGAPPLALRPRHRRRRGLRRRPHLHTPPARRRTA